MSENPPKDRWDKLQILSIAIAGILIPAAIALAANMHGTSVQTAESRVHYLELAISILRDDPKPETNAIRDWAIELLDNQSRDLVPLTAEAKAELKSHRAFQYIDYSSYYSSGNIGPGCCGEKEHAQKSRGEDESPRKSRTHTIK